MEGTAPREGAGARGAPAAVSAVLAALVGLAVAAEPEPVGAAEGLALAVRVAPIFGGVGMAILGGLVVRYAAKRRRGRGGREAHPELAALVAPVEDAVAALAAAVREAPADAGRWAAALAALAADAEAPLAHLRARARVEADLALHADVLGLLAVTEGRLADADACLAAGRGADAGVALETAAVHLADLRRAVAGAGTA